MSPAKPQTVEVTRIFHLLQPLGEGAMGEVYEAVDPDLGQRVAIKMLRAELVADLDVRERFEAEAEIMATIDHPGNLPVYGLGVDDERRPFYAMKKVAGRTLGELLSERGGRTADLAWLRRLLDVFEAACDTVACAHEHGIVHRDLKPANILVDDEHGSVYVIDWGIAKRVPAPGDGGGAPTVFGAVMGSPGYLAPEQARGDSAAAGPQADVFALGVILYQILTASQPFVGGSARESLLRAVHHQPQDPRRLNFWVSRSIAAVCLKALEKDPHRRYPTARSLAAEVRAYRAGRRVSVTRQSLAERARGWSMRWPTRAALALAAAAAVSVLALFVGAQVWIDHRLAEKAFESIAETDASVAEIDRQLRALASGPGLAPRRKELASRRLVHQFEAMELLVNVAQLRFIRTSDEVFALGRARVFATVESSLDSGEPEFAKALAAIVLERAEAGTALLRYSGGETERLRALVSEADAAMARPVPGPEPKDP